jgi:K+-sensing histidine kinase KdpD
MLQWILIARSWHALVRIGLATIAVAVATVWRLPGEPFMLYFVAVVASASALGRTAGFVAVAGSTIASLFLFEPVYSPKVTHAVDLLA